MLSFPFRTRSRPPEFPRYNYPVPNSEKVRVLFICIGNACRSPMAESIALREASDIIEPSSAGLYPLGCIVDQTAETLLRNGYSPQGLSSKPIEREALASADLVINMTGERYDNAFAQAKKVEDWDAADPYGEDLQIYQRTLEEIKGRVQRLAGRLRQERQQKLAAAARAARAAG